MDSEGYLPVTLIASFHRVHSFTTDLAVVVEAVRCSDKLELCNGFKVSQILLSLCTIVDKRNGTLLLITHLKQAQI